MPFGNFTCVLITYFKNVHELNVLFSYSVIKKNDVMPACKICLPVGMTDVKYDVIFVYVSKQISTSINNLIKFYRVFRVLDEV